MKRLSNFLILLTVATMTACSTNGNREGNGLETILIGEEAPIADMIKIKEASFISGPQSKMTVPSKLVKWGENYLYQSMDIYAQNTYLVLFDENWNVISWAAPSTGAPGSFREITDFFVKDDLVHIYDFQSQKFVSFDKELKFVSEKRTPFYYKTFINLDTAVLAYSGKMTQWIEQESYSFDLISLNAELDPIDYYRSFSQERYGSMIFHTLRPLLHNSSDIFYSEWWNDTLYTYSSEKGVVPRALFKYEGKELPAEVKKLGHSEIYQNLQANQYVEYLKGASPMCITDKQMLYSYGHKDRIKYGVYDMENRESKVFSDYNYSLDENLLIPVYAEGDQFVSVIYPYELTDYIHSGIVKENELDEEFLERLFKEAPDGSPIMIKYTLTSD